MCPLANENFRTESVIRVGDNATRNYNEWKARYWRYDPRLRREREYSDAELAVLARQPRGDVAHTITGLEADMLDRKERSAKIAEQNEQAQQAQVSADLKRKHEAALLKMRQDEFQLDVVFTAETQETRSRVMNYMANNQIPLTPTHAWRVLAEMKAGGRL
jgi:hypothetical protein